MTRLHSACSRRRSREKAGPELPFCMQHQFLDNRPRAYHVKYLHQLLTSDVHSGSIELRDIDGATLAAVIGSLFTAELPVTTETVRDVLSCADMLHVRCQQRLATICRGCNKLIALASFRCLAC